MGARSRRRHRESPPPHLRRQPITERKRPPAPVRFERRARRPPPPPGPWGSFPITEITIAVGIVIVVVALVGGATPRSPRFVAGALVCAAGVVELMVREHMSGYRSHTLLLSFLPVVAVQGLIAVAHPAPAVQAAFIAVDFVLFAVSFQIWQRIYKRVKQGH